MIYTKQDRLAFLWQDMADGAEVLHVYADTPQIRIPDKIDGKNIISIGAYCFSDTNRIEAGIDTNITGEWEKKSNLHEFCGSYIEEIALPDTIVRIANNAFYNCRNMTVLEAGSRLTELGSDVFMNCRSFRRLNLRYKADEPGGLKQILSRYSSSLEVYFYDEDRVDAVLVYPEYTDSYDEIAPAHIFGRNITGEGFRARQCFSGDVPDMRQYDAIFDKASAEESVDILYKMVLGRLMYPVMLDDVCKTKYEIYLNDNQKEIIRLLTDSKELGKLSFIFRNKYIDAVSADMAIAAASNSGWGEGAASLLKWKHEFLAPAKRSRYKFD